MATWSTITLVLVVTMLRQEERVITSLTVSASPVESGYLIRRSDGVNFILRLSWDGHGNLLGSSNSLNGEMVPVVDFKPDVADKLGRAKQYALAFPGRPPGP